MTNTPSPMLSRRKVLRGMALAGGATMASGAAVLSSRSTSAIADSPSRATSRTPAGYQPWLWSDPRSWDDGRVPGPGDLAVVTRPILVQGDVSVGAVTITPTGALIFAAHTSTQLASSGNVLVEGRLVMRPDGPHVRHRLVFPDIDETEVRGATADTHLHVSPTDIGLWVTHAGELDLVGSEKTPWTRAAGDIAAGATSIRLQATPVGWQVGDELQVVPTLAPTSGTASVEGYDAAVVTAITGDTVILSAPTSHSHPRINGKWAAEVLNLSRNVRIEGSPAGRAHIQLLHVMRPQTIRNVAIRHVGPRFDTGSTYRKSGQRVPITEGFRGRYGLHFHMSRDKSRGSLIENVVVAQCGNHAFVAHESHGVTFRGCIAHDTWDDAYWWDMRDGGPGDTHPDTHDVLYQDCVASLVQVDPPHQGRRLAGFKLLEGLGNAAVGCVAVGVRGGKNAAGFNWPEGSQGVWLFEDCVAHNNASNGMFVWQNTRNEHIIERFTAYHNGQSGIEHGAYRNSYKYRNCDLYGNRDAQLIVHATSRTGHDGLQFHDLLCDGAGISPYAVEFARHNLDGDIPTLFADCHFKGFTSTGLAFTYTGSNGESQRELVDVMRCRFGGNEFWLDSNINPESYIRVQDSPSGSYALRRADKAGELIKAWNASRSAISRFTR